MSPWVLHKDQRQASSSASKVPLSMCNHHFSAANTAKQISPSCKSQNRNSRIHSIHSIAHRSIHMYTVRQSSKDNPQNLTLTHSLSSPPHIYFPHTFLCIYGTALFLSQLCRSRQPGRHVISRTSRRCDAIFLCLNLVVSWRRVCDICPSGKK